MQLNHSHLFDNKWVIVYFFLIFSQVYKEFELHIFK